MLRAGGIYTLAAAAEIGGCFAIWAVLRLGRGVFWLLPGVLLLVACMLLKKQEK